MSKLSTSTAKDETGKSYGKLTVLSRLDNDKAGNTRWLCRCKCGNTTPVLGKNLRRGQVGCRQCLVKHGHNRGGKRSATYRAWCSMIERCRRPRCKCYHNYGGRGITVCQRWLDSFADFLADMGPKPKGLTLERKDVDGNYEPGNCCWTTRREQDRNKRGNRFITIDGQTKVLTDWCNHFGIRFATAHMRLASGWTEEAALKTPVR